ncbi:MAG: glycosyltransferase [Verrucomicrobia bacterium]|nr:glycosyltransferase [Verrucomicrobiota bacterium]
MKKRRTICLNMIVKNEAKVIKRCLTSVKPFIDYWVISDTGSTDGTQEIIREFMKDIPGELMERPWVDFSHNRNEVLRQSKGKGDFLLFIDGDEWLEIAPDFVMPNFEKDCYVASVRVSDGSVYQRVLIINNRIPWEWKGVVHEDIHPTKINGYEFLKGLTNVSNTGDGYRSSDPKKYLKDAEVLKRAFEKEPDNCRYAYYLAQCYEEAQEYKLSLEMFQIRSKMKGWAEEIFYAFYKIGKLQQILGYPPEIFIDSYCKAYQNRPTRAEPLHRLVNHYLTVKNYFLAYHVSKFALSLPRCTDCMLVEHPIYDYSIMFQVAESALYLGKFKEAHDLFVKLIANPKTPRDVKDWLQKNLAYVASRMKATV